MNERQLISFWFIFYMDCGKMNSIPCINWMWNFFERVPTHDDLKNGLVINKKEFFSWTISCQEGETTKTLWISLLSIPIISTSLCSTCVKICFLKENMPRPFREMPNTSSSSKILETMWPCARYWHKCILTKNGVPSWTHIINAHRDLFVIWPSMYILRVVMIQDS